MPTLRPIEMRVNSPPFDVSDTSNARLELRTQMVTLRRGVTLQKPSATSGAAGLGVGGPTHANQAPIEMRRFAPASQADIRFKRRDAWSVRFQHMLDGQPAALGFVMPVDGLPIRIAIPPDLWAQGSTSDAKWRALRTTRYFGSAWSGDALWMVRSPFARQWLAQIYFAALSYEALYRQIGLQEAEEALAAGTAAVSVTQVLDSIFQSPSSLTIKRATARTTLRTAYGRTSRSICIIRMCCAACRNSRSNYGCEWMRHGSPGCDAASRRPWPRLSLRPFKTCARRLILTGSSWTWIRATRARGRLRRRR